MSNRKILLADDSVTIQKVVNLTFADEGIDVVTFGDGDSALAALRDVRPDLVLADVNMPGANGYQICEAMRAADDTRHIPVILLVGSFEPFDEAAAERAGANGHLTKPFQSIRMLVTQVTEMIGAASQAETVEEEEKEDSLEIEIPLIQPERRTDDIDSLYHRSVGEPAAEHAQAAPVSFADQGMDDEMIETERIGPGEPYSESDAATVSFSAGEFPAHGEAGRHEYAVDFELPPPVSEEPREAEQPPPVWELAGHQSHAEQGYERQGDEQFSSYEPAPPQHHYEPERPAEEYYSAPEAESGRVSVEARPETGTFDYVPPSEEPVRTTDPFAAPAEPAPQGYMGEQTVAFEMPPAPAATGSSFDDIDLLDLPPVGSNETIELTTAERAELMGSNKRAVSISPELMEIIVEKVVEKLSRKY